IVVCNQFHHWKQNAVPYTFACQYGHRLLKLGDSSDHEAADAHDQADFYDFWLFKLFQLF
ncbi:MAG: hypothetical protein KKA56_05280, partial [Gammaproteobacteria bacterium]|nr:hypothetical protein [Gammaproteobacteria bacterium]